VDHNDDLFKGCSNDMLMTELYKTIEIHIMDLLVE